MAEAVVMDVQMAPATAQPPFAAFGYMPAIPSPEKMAGAGSIDRDIALAEVERKTTSSFIRAWEESEKTKADNKAHKKLSAIASWENNKRAAAEAKLRRMEEKLEEKNAEYAEKIRNEVSLVHKQAEEERAMVAAKRTKAILKVEETAAKYHATGHVPKKKHFFRCF